MHARDFQHSISLCHSESIQLQLTKKNHFAIAGEMFLLSEEFLECSERERERKKFKILLEGNKDASVIGT